MYFENNTNPGYSLDRYFIVIILKLCILLDLSALEKYDSQKMYKVYDR